MKILRHKLFESSERPFDFAASPNIGGKLEPRYLIIHYTAGRSAQESINWFLNPDASASAHLVIARDGAITQQVPFNRVAWHAGQSSWQNLVGLNHHSIGIELDNAGRLTRQGNSWRAWFGGAYPDNEVVVATHKNENTPSGWHSYTEAQIDAAIRVARTLVDAYGLIDVLGHEDISPGRKSDPGPAFPMSSFRSRVLGRAADEPAAHISTTALNIRTGPGTQFPLLPGSPLPLGTRMQVIGSQGSWRLVDVLDVISGFNDLQGWVHARFIVEAAVSNIDSPIAVPLPPGT
jgi:N-acetylmuramoyl-L-alanine amidase